jgi:hypothetical protein
MKPGKTRFDARVELQRTYDELHAVEVLLYNPRLSDAKRRELEYKKVRLKTRHLAMVAAYNRPVRSGRGK